MTAREIRMAALTIGLCGLIAGAVMLWSERGAAILLDMALLGGQMLCF